MKLFSIGFISTDTEVVFVESADIGVVFVESADTGVVFVVIHTNITKHL